MTQEQSDLMRKILKAKKGEDIQFLDEGWCLRWLLNNGFEEEHYIISKNKKTGLIDVTGDSPCPGGLGCFCKQIQKHIIKNQSNLLTALLKLVLQIMREVK